MICRELALRQATGGDVYLDNRLYGMINNNKRARQFALSMADYLIAASGLPMEMMKITGSIFLKNK